MNNIFKLIICLGLPQIVSFLGALATISSVKTWYLTLNKPFFNPPSWIFGPVWSVLYLLMGFSSYYIWKKQESYFKSKALNHYLIQLFLNLTWSFAFFGLKSPMLAFIVIIVLLIYIFKCVILFQKIDKRASFLLYPYLVWVSFASILNFSIWYLN